MSAQWVKATRAFAAKLSMIVLSGTLLMIAAMIRNNKCTSASRASAMLRRIESPIGAQLVVDGRTLLNFGGTSYLGLGAEPSMLEAGAQALRSQGATGTIPRHYGFATPANLDAEAAALEYFGVEAAIYFATGYLFGLVGMAGLASRFDVAILDESTHYNLRDGALAAGKPVQTFRHVDADDLARVLEREISAGNRPLVATDGMFPTFGTVPPLAEYARLLAPHAGWMLVDESHAFGVLGAGGRGAVEHHGVAGPLVVAGGSLGKAFGAYGGIAVGSTEAICDLWKSPASRGAASGMSSGAAMAAASMRFLRQHPERLATLRANARRLKTGLRQLGLAIVDSDGPVATFVHGTAATMQALQADLMVMGIYVIYSTYVGAGPEGAIRCAAFADHEPSDIDRLVEAISRLL